MARESGTQDLPLCADLDGTVIRSDILFEQVAALFRDKPLHLFLLPWWLLRGRAYLKARIAALTPLDPATLPYQQDLLSYLKDEHARGRAIHLVSASNHENVQSVSAHLGVFTSAQGSDAQTNLKGLHKAAWLRQAFPGGFVYAGDSAADLHVWRISKGAIPVNASRRTLAQLPSTTQEEARFGGRPPFLLALARAMRLSHWSKNTLIFLPLILAHQAGNLREVGITVLGFFLYSFLASTTYIFNDLLDLPVDRLHRTKRNRPLASGDLPLPAITVLLPVMYVAGLAGCFVLSWRFALVAVAYLILTTVYSLWLKRLVLIDVMTLAVLFTLRILLGVVLLDQVVSVWLMMFSLSFFGGLSFIKRYVEIMRLDESRGDQIAGRGYRRGDEALMAPWGMGTSIMSVVVLVFYIVNDQMPAGLYHNKAWLWALPFLVYYWSTRVWLLTLRGQMQDDPVEFAIRDRASLCVGLLMALAVALAAV